MNRMCVLFAGNSGAGKDTAADMLHNIMSSRHYSARKMAFADPIKEILVHLLGIPKYISYGSQQVKLQHEVYDKSTRHWLQWVGTDMARNQIHQDIWVHRFVERALESHERIVIGTDCRFLNEMSVVRELLNGRMDLMIIKIVNPRVPVNLDHQSESEIYHTPDDLFDMVIDNSGEFMDLKAVLVGLTGTILNRLS